MSPHPTGPASRSYHVGSVVGSRATFGASPRARAKWTQGLDFKPKDARKEPVEYLWFVGDYASYSPSVVDITRKTADVFQRAGLDFGILYEGEHNTGNDVRRVGDRLAERRVPSVVGGA